MMPSIFIRDDAGTPMTTLHEEIGKRKTFAIISHPDAGKTTLTEKLLLFGGQIQTAGAVKSNKITKSTTSDFMAIEKQRGISVATSVMSFEYRDLKINILDTPGHKDFAEDTYRTLTAVDSVILVIDSVKGVEAQTERLMEVCRMRRTPVIVFINKLDREGQDPFELLDEIEAKLAIRVTPLSWPISRGRTFKGVYNRFEHRLNLFRPNSERVEKDIVQIEDLASPLLDEQIDTFAAKLREDITLIDGVYDRFDTGAYLTGDIAPVFFGSAVNNFGIRELLDAFCRIAPVPRPRMTDTRLINPDEAAFSGFVFKIHANLDPKHRNRMVFVRVCSGTFERSKYYHHVRLDKELRFSAPVSFIGQKKETIDEAYPGDVVGIFDVGNFKIGDTLTEGERFNFQGIPAFSPEIFRLLTNKSFEKVKQLEKGLQQLTDEGVAQLFVQDQGRRKIVGTVGQLQFEVLQYRLEHEYGALCEFVPLSFTKACWLTAKDQKKLDEFCRYRSTAIATDKDGNIVFFADSDYMLNHHRAENPDIEFHTTSEFKRAAG